MREWDVPGYTEVRALGSGGFGDVVLARHEETGTLVAVKYLRPALLDDPEFVAMFRDEARVLASLDDPNVVRLYEYVESASGAAIVMELVDGVSLREILSRAGKTSAEAALVVLQGSLLGLAAAHARGVVHRDYKPENVLVDGAGASKLTDFGIAARSGDRPIPAGTLAYAPPEQFGPGPATPAGDVYAATATFYECLAGHPPFSGDTAEALLAQHQSAPVPLEPVPEPLRPLVTAGMAKDPAGRPADAASFIAELRAAAGPAYGEDWETRGRSHLGEAALLLAALWPSGTAPAVQGHAVEQVHLSQGAQEAKAPQHPGPGQEHAEHLEHVEHLEHEHAEHVRHVEHLEHEHAEHAEHVEHVEHVEHLEHEHAEHVEHLERTEQLGQAAPPTPGLSGVGTTASQRTDDAESAPEPVAAAAEATLGATAPPTAASPAGPARPVTGMDDLAQLAGSAVAWFKRGGRRRRIIFGGIVGGLLLIIIIVIALPSGSPPSQPAAQSGEAAAAQGSCPPAPSGAGPSISGGTVTGSGGGDVNSVDLVQVIDPAPGMDSYFQPQSGDHFVGLVFKVTDEAGPDPFYGNTAQDASFTGSDGQGYTPADDFIAGWCDLSDGFYSLHAGQSKEVEATFEVPNGVKVTQVQWDVPSGTWTVNE